MRKLFSAIALLALATIVAGADLVRTFDADMAGAPPPGFAFAMTRQPSPGRWLVQAEGANHYLAHLADPAAAGGFSLAVLEVSQPADVHASVRLKLADGERTGGLLWRYRDAENFYLVALDLREQNVALYRVVRGNRIKLEEEDDLELDRDAWHVVRVVHEGDRIRVLLGGISVMRVRDRAAAGPGRAGVWSGGGSTGRFDDLRVEEAREERDPRGERNR